MLFCVSHFLCGSHSLNKNLFVLISIEFLFPDLEKRRLSNVMTAEMVKEDCCMMKLLMPFFAVELVTVEILPIFKRRLDWCVLWCQAYPGWIIVEVNGIF